MAIPISISTLSGLDSSITGSIYSNAMTYKNPIAALTFYKLNGLPVPSPTVIYPNITT